MLRRPALLLVPFLLAASCTSAQSSQPDTSDSTSPGDRVGAPPQSSPAPSIDSVVLPVIADAGGGGAVTGSNGYVEGMQLAADRLSAGRGVDGRPVEVSVRDSGGDPSEAERLLVEAIEEAPPALLFVGPGPVLASVRQRLQETRTPAILLQGDLYTSRGLFREVFQTTPPWQWQAHVIARYLVLDRRAGRVVFAGFGPEAEEAASVARASLSYWGGQLRGAVTAPAGELPPSMVTRAGRADAVIVFGPAADVRRLARALERMESPPRIAGSAALLGSDLPPGSTAVYTYAWGGWAEPIPRVGTFRERFRERFGRLPRATEQEGYDAVVTLVEGLRRTRGAGGSKLTSVLEALPARARSSLPVALGPDDHVFLPRDELGLFAVAGRGEELDPWQTRGIDAWRPLMRTFTYGGERTSILDRDRRVFFPAWRKDRPGPKYWRSQYGITTRPSDPVH